MWTSTYGKVTNVFETKNTTWITIEFPKQLTPFEEPFKDWLDEPGYEE